MISGNVFLMGRINSNGSLVNGRRILLSKLEISATFQQSELRSALELANYLVWPSLEMRGEAPQVLLH